MKNLLCTHLLSSQLWSNNLGKYALKCLFEGIMQTANTLHRIDRTLMVNRCLDNYASTEYTTIKKYDTI